MRPAGASQRSDILPKYQSDFSRSSRDGRRKGRFAEVSNPQALEAKKAGQCILLIGALSMMIALLALAACGPASSAAVSTHVRPDPSPEALSSPSLDPSSKSRLEVRINTGEEEWQRIASYLRRSHFFVREGYRLSFPEHPAFQRITREGAPPTFEEIEKLREVFMQEIYDPTLYEAALRTIAESEPGLEEVLSRFEKWQSAWGFKTFDTYIVRLTRYGTGGSYCYLAGEIILRVEPDGSFGRGANPWHTIVHEMVHIGVEEAIVIPLQLGHWEKELLVDIVTQRAFGHLLPGYKVGEQGPRDLGSVVANADLDNLLVQLERWRQDNPSVGPRLLVRSSNTEEEWSRLLELLADPPAPMPNLWPPLPDHQLVNALAGNPLAKSDQERLRGVFEDELLEDEIVAHASRTLHPLDPRFEGVFADLRDWQSQWGFELLDEYEIRFTQFGYSEVDQGTGDIFIRVAPSYSAGGPFRLMIESIVRGGIMEPLVKRFSLDEVETERVVHHLSRYLLREVVPNYEIHGKVHPLDEVLTLEALTDLPAAISRWRN